MRDARGHPGRGQGEDLAPKRGKGDMGPRGTKWVMVRIGTGNGGSRAQGRGMRGCRKAAGGVMWVEGWWIGSPKALWCPPQPVDSCIRSGGPTVSRAPLPVPSSNRRQPNSILGPLRIPCYLPTFTPAAKNWGSGEDGSRPLHGGHLLERKGGMMVVQVQEGCGFRLSRRILTEPRSFLSPP